MRWVAFLRAINTGDRRVTMDELRMAAATIPGLENPMTYIASGNLIFDMAESPQIDRRLEEALASHLGFDVPVFLRSAAEVRAIAEARPFPNLGDWRMHVSFLPEVPAPGRVEALLEASDDENLLAVLDRQVYWAHPGTMSESTHREADVVEILGMPTTRRSITTVRRLAAKYLT